jgi:hypothetical protein
MKSPLAPARTSERATEWVINRTLAKPGDGCNFLFEEDLPARSLSSGRRIF